jgi:tetratricopeptide (TPR) repeat protein
MLATAHYALLTVLAMAAAAGAQSPTPESPPRAPMTEPEKQELEARKLYAVAAMQQKQGLFLSALKAMEECLRLDPDAIPPRRALAALYLSVGRPDEALVMAKSVTERDPADFEAWQRYADQLHDLGKAKESLAALGRAVVCESAARHPQQLLLMLNRLGSWADKAGDFDAAEKAHRRFLAVLDENRERFRNSGFLGDNDFLAEKADAWEKVGEDCLKSGRHEPALRAFEQAREIFRGRDDDAAKGRLHRSHWHLAQVCAAMGDAREAISHVQEYLRLIKTNSMEPYRLLVEQSRKLREGAVAPTRLEPYARRAPENLPLQLLLAEQYRDANRFDAAQELYVKLLKKQIKPEIYQGLFRLYEKYERMPLALAKFDEYCVELDKDKEKDEKKTEIPRKHVAAMMSVLARNPSLVRKMLPLAEAERLRQFRQQNFDYRTYDRLAGLMARWDDLDLAETVLREALRALETRPGQMFFRASTDEALIQVLMARRKYADVKAICRDGLRVEEMNNGLNKFLYSVYLDFSLAKLGEIDNALEVNDQAVLLANSDGNRFYSRMHRVDILQQAGRLEEALAECEKILKEIPAPRFARRASIRTASLLSRMRRYEEGEKIVRGLVEQDPNDAEACNFLGYELADRSKNLDEAEKLIRRALELDRRARQSNDGGEDEADPFDYDNAAYLDSLGWVLFRKGKLAEARQILEQAVSQPDGKQSADLWDHLGDICFRIGDRAEAAKAWQKAVDFYREERPGKKDSRPDEAARKLRMAN